MMQHQDTERFPPTNTNKTDIYVESNETANEEEMELFIDFENVEDILDFSAHSVTDGETLKQRPRQLRKMTAEEPVKLLELKPIIDNFVNEVQGNKTRRY